MPRAAIILEDYNPLWPSKFEKEKEHLSVTAGKWLYGNIEHVLPSR